MLEMIPEPYFPLTLIIILPVLGIALGSFSLTLHTDNKFYFIIGIIMVISIMSIAGYYDYSEGEKYQKLWNEHNRELEKIISTSDCNILPELYDQEYYKKFKEKIKSKYIFDCVAEKEQLEMLK
jgi:hypothetical protein